VQACNAGTKYSGSGLVLMKKILIVDDDKKGTAPLTIRLKAAGYYVVTAATATEGLKQAVHHRPDLIIMDIWMPDGLGILVAQRLKHFGLAEVPVVFLTAGRKEEMWPIVEEVKPAGFFEKPYDSRELMAAIATMLAQSTLSAALVSARNPNLQNPKARYEKNTDC
jgi:DNA-binding response OmpR family regulator